MSARNAEDIVEDILRLQGMSDSLAVRRERQKLMQDLLRMLPQGHNSGLNADLVDGMHAEDIIKKARVLIGGGGGATPYTLEVHGANKHDHTVWYAIITPAGAILPASNAPALTKVTGTNFTYYVLDFDKATSESIFAQFKLPPNYSPGDDIEIIIEWISTLIVGAVKWGAQILGRADGETFDSSLSSEQTVTTTTDGTAGKMNTSTITISSPLLDAEDVFILKIRRVAADAADTMDADARMVMAGVRL